MLRAALAATGAERGNVQIRGPAGELMIVAQRGFTRDFLDHFAVVTNDDGSACGRAAEEASQTVIVDVNDDPGFAPHRSIAAASGFRAVVSTPLIGASGLVGVVSVHFPRPHCPSTHELRSLRQLGDTAGITLGRLAAGKLNALATPVHGDLIERGMLLADFVRDTLVNRGRSDFDALTVEVADAFGLAGAGVSVADGRAMRTVAAQNDRAAVLELAQERSGAGPCVECQRTGRPVLVADLATRQSHWEKYARAAASMGVVSVAAIPIRLGGMRFGALDLYHGAPHRWTTQEVRMADELARMAASSAFEMYRARVALGRRASLRWPNPSP